MARNEIMHCPYCAEMIQSGAIVCRFCCRDLVASKPTMDENVRLKTEISKLQQEIARLREADNYIDDISKQQRGHVLFYKVGVLINYGAGTIGALLLSHYVFQITMDLHAVITNLICVAIAMVGGFVMALRNSISVPAVVLLAALVGAGSVLGMSLVVALYYHQPFLPSDSRVGQDSIEFSVSICLAFIGGVFLGQFYRNSFLSRSLLGEAAKNVIYTIAFSDNEKERNDRIRLVERAFTAIAAVATIVTSVSAALKAALGS